MNAFAEQTAPIQPKIKETPLPPAITLPAPEKTPADVPNRPLTAEEAARIALTHQPNVAIAQAGVVTAKGGVTRTKAALLPTVAGAGSYNSIAHAPATDFPGTGAATGYQLSANVRQLIFDFNHTRDLAKQASQKLRAANANMTKVESDTVLRVKQAFYAYAQSTKLVAVNEANVKNAQSHLALAQARLDAGVGLPTDVVRAQTAVANSIFNLNLARNTASLAGVSLAEQIGIDPRTPIVPADTGESEIDIDDLVALTQQALESRPEVAQAEANLSAAGYSVSAAKTSSAPAVSANAGWMQRGTDFPPGNNTLTYGVALQWTPFDSGLTAGRVEEARGALLAAEADMEAAELKVTSDVSRGYVDLKTAEQRVITSEAEVANALEALRLVEGRYKSGLGTFLDVLDAQTAYINADSNKVNAHFSVDQARSALAHAIGRPLTK
ncbi:MAG: TolC family protein [Armatimonadetes bacterium]|nr:TolC family protein [Armatimonadota bacterium]